MKFYNVSENNLIYLKAKLKAFVHLNFHEFEYRIC